MWHLTLSILVTLAVLLGSAGESFALPECPGSPTKSTKVWTSWNNCEGTATDAKGDKYVGEWKDGKRHGQGTDTYAGGGKYVGEYKDGNRHGQGTYAQGNGEKYVGELKDGKPHGQGTVTFVDGRVQQGIWENGKLKPWWKFW